MTRSSVVLKWWSSYLTELKGDKASPNTQPSFFDRNLQWHTETPPCVEDELERIASSRGKAFRVLGSKDLLTFENSGLTYGCPAVAKGLDAKGLCHHEFKLGGFCAAAACTSRSDAAGGLPPSAFAPLRYTDSCASDLLCLLFAEDALVDLELSNLWSACAVKFNLAIPKSFNTDLGHVRR